MKLIKIGDVESLAGLRSTMIYGGIRAGTFPPPIKLTARASVWVEDEILAVNAARVAGCSDEQIRVLVGKLIAERQRHLPPMLAAPTIPAATAAAA